MDYHKQMNKSTIPTMNQRIKLGLLLLIVSNLSWANMPTPAHVVVPILPGVPTPKTVDTPTAAETSFGVDINLDPEVKISNLQDLQMTQVYSENAVFSVPPITGVCIYSNTTGNQYNITFSGENKYTGPTGTVLQNTFSYQLNNTNPDDPHAQNWQIWYNITLTPMTGGTPGTPVFMTNGAASPTLSGSNSPSCTDGKTVSLSFKFLSSHYQHGDGAYYGAYLDTISITVVAV